MKKLLLAAALAASFSGPVMAGDLLPLTFRHSGIVTSIPAGAPPTLIRFVIAGPLNYQAQYNIQLAAPDGTVVNPIFQVPLAGTTLNGLAVTKQAQAMLVGATCTVTALPANWSPLGKTYEVYKPIYNAIPLATSSATCTK